MNSPYRVAFTEYPGSLHLAGWDTAGAPPNWTAPYLSLYRPMLPLLCLINNCVNRRRSAKAGWRASVIFYSALLGGSVSGVAPLALAPQAIAQNVIDGLPPPPSIPDLDPPPASAPEPAVAEPTNESTVDNVEAAPPVTPSRQTGTYRVVVNSDSPFLLEQVRRLEPAADFERDQDQFVIVAGQFDQQEEAEALVEALAAQGIGAEVAVSGPSEAVPLAPPTATAPQETRRDSDAREANNRSSGDGDAFAQPGSSIAADLSALPPADLGATPTQGSIVDPAQIEPATPDARQGTSNRAAPVASGQSAPLPSRTARASESPPADSDYYIVVPGEASALAQMQGQIALLGAAPEAIAQRDRPLGPHLLIGPFDSRQSAARWNTFLRDFGMDARVYYRR